MKDIPNGSIDMILADLPYGTTANKWDTVINLEEMWRHYERTIKDNGVICLFSSQPFTTSLINSNPNLFRCSYLEQKKTYGTDFLPPRPCKNKLNLLLDLLDVTLY